MTVAVTALIKFYMALKVHIKQHATMKKIIAFKIIVGLTFFEGVRPDLSPSLRVYL